MCYNVNHSNSIGKGRNDFYDYIIPEKCRKQTNVPLRHVLINLISDKREIK